MGKQPEVATRPKGSKLLETQWKFMRMLPALISKAHELGYEFTLGDGYRDPRAFGIMGTAKGYGQAKSAHKQRLAIDLNLWKDGKYLTKTEDYAALGEYWESLGGTWGGRFSTGSGDGNHFSIKFGGVA